MPRRRWRHAIVALTDVSAEFAQRIERPDVALHRSRQDGRATSCATTRACIACSGSSRPAIVHTRNLAALEAVVPAWAAGVPVRIHGEHGWDMQDPAGKRRRYRARAPALPAVRQSLRRAVAPSRGLSRAAGRHRRPDRIAQIYNGVDTERFRPSRGGRPAIPGCPFAEPGQWLVGTVGRMEAIKDPLNLARAFVRAQAARARRGASACGWSWSATARCAAEVQQVLERAGVARSRLVRRRARRRARDHARPRLLRPAVARRGRLQHDPRGDGDRASGRRDPRRRQFRADRIRDDRDARSAGQQRRAGAGDARLLQRPQHGASPREGGASGRRGPVQPDADGVGLRERVRARARRGGQSRSRRATSEPPDRARSQSPRRTRPSRRTEGAARHVRHRRNHRRFGHAGDRPRPRLAPERNAAPSRAGRSRTAPRAGRRPRPPPAFDHRSVDRAAAALQRGRQRRRRLQRRDLQLPGADPRARRASATSSGPRATPR